MFSKISLILIFLFKFAAVMGDELKKMALDGDPQSLCAYADQLDIRDLNRFKNMPTYLEIYHVMFHSQSKKKWVSIP
jgi:hypothetical protein